MFSRVKNFFAATIFIFVTLNSARILAQPDDAIFYQDVSWSPDGTRLLLSRLDIKGGQYFYRIYSVNTDGSEYQQITEGPSDVWTSWSRYDSRFVYTSKKNGNDDIYLANADGTRPLRLTHDTAREYHPDWSPDGARLAFVTKMSIPQVYIMNGDGSKLRITNDSVQKGNPRWSPDGKRIAYYGNVESGQDSIYIIDADGKNKFTLCEGVWPSWTPDGSNVLFSQDDAIYQINLDNTGKRKLIDNAFFASWSPDGKKIAFIRRTWKADKEWPATSAVFVANSGGTGEVRITPERQ